MLFWVCATLYTLRWMDILEELKMTDKLTLLDPLVRCLHTFILAIEYSTNLDI